MSGTGDRRRRLAGLLLVIASAGAHAQEDAETLRERAERRLAQQLAAPLPAQDPALPPEVSAVPAGEEERRATLAALERPAQPPEDPLWLTNLLGAWSPLQNRAVLALGASQGGKWPDLDSGGARERPAWWLDALAARLRAASLSPRAPAAAPAPVRGRQSLAWRKPDGGAAGSTSLDGADAVAWAGPAVRDGVARYRQVAGRTQVRIPMLPGQGEELHAWARKLGLGLDLRLRTAGPEVGFPVAEARTAMPVWLLSPEGLQPATVTAFSMGADSCAESQWLELALENASQPPVWAVFAFARPELGQGVTVRRVRTAAPDPAPYLEGQRGELEVRWPGDWLPGVNVVARRFDYREERHEEQPNGETKLVSSELVGSAWGVQVFSAAPAPQIVTTAQRVLLSAGGSPACAPP